MVEDFSYELKSRWYLLIDLSPRSIRRSNLQLLRRCFQVDLRERKRSEVDESSEWWAAQKSNPEPMNYEFTALTV